MDDSRSPPSSPSARVARRLEGFEDGAQGVTREERARCPMAGVATATRGARDEKGGSPTPRDRVYLTRSRWRGGPPLSSFALRVLLATPIPSYSIMFSTHSALISTPVSRTVPAMAQAARTPRAAPRAIWRRARRVREGWWVMSSRWLSLAATP